MATKLVMLSGGLDSVGMTHLLLKSAKDKELHIHHINIENAENRAKAEAAAVKSIIEYFQTNDYPEFVYTESTIASPNFGRSYMYDSDAVNFMAGYICSLNKDITQVAIGMNKEDMNGPQTTRIQRANQLLLLYTDAKKVYPVEQYTKKEIYQLLPDELRNLFWSCRTPRYIDNKAHMCGHCYTCNQFERLGIIPS